MGHQAVEFGGILGLLGDVGIHGSLGHFLVASPAWPVSGSVPSETGLRLRCPAVSVRVLIVGEA